MRLGWLQHSSRAIRLVGDFDKPLDEKTVAAQEYIRQEARTIFEQNAHVMNPHAINKSIQDAHDRMDIAVHYKIPYPRHHHYEGANQKGMACIQQMRVLNSRPLYPCLSARLPLFALAVLLRFALCRPFISENTLRVLMPSLLPVPFPNPIN